MEDVITMIWRIVILMHSYIMGFARLMGLGCGATELGRLSALHGDFECCRENLITEHILSFFFFKPLQSLNKRSPGRPLDFSDIAIWRFWREKLAAVFWAHNDTADIPSAKSLIFFYPSPCLNWEWLNNFWQTARVSVFWERALISV